MINIYKYFTVWSLFISYSIFIWSFLISIPRWLFLFAASILTMTSIMGTFFITIPAVELKGEKRNISNKQVVLEDSLIHSGPLIIFLLFFSLLLKNTTPGDKPEDIRKPFIFLLFFILIYYSSINFEQVYESFDYFTILVLSGAIFASSYQLYVSIIL